jgi:hypothetical protein
METLFRRETLLRREYDRLKHESRRSGVILGVARLLDFGGILGISPRLRPRSVNRQAHDRSRQDAQSLSQDGSRLAEDFCRVSARERPSSL